MPLSPKRLCANDSCRTPLASLNLDTLCFRCQAFPPLLTRQLRGNLPSHKSYRLAYCPKKEKAAHAR